MWRMDTGVASGTVWSMIRPARSPLQMRLTFGEPTSGMHVALSLDGDTVCCTPQGGTPAGLWELLCGAAASPSLDGTDTVRFPVAALASLRELPDTVTLEPDAGIAALVDVVLYPPDDGVAATVEVAGDALRLCWLSNEERFEAELVETSLPAMLACGVPFVATAEAWERLRRADVVAGTIAVARENLDGFVEITASVPQLVEGAPLPGLFRTDASTHFGLSLAYAHLVGSTPGFRWEGPVPVPEVPAADAELGFEISEHHRRDLTQVVERLACSGALVLWWDSGLGRRVMALAALCSLDAWPALVVCAPATVWAWQRHLDLVGRSGALTHQRGDVRIVTYRDLAAGVALASPAAVLLDDPCSGEATRPGARAALHRLDALSGVPRLATTSVWPEDPAEQVAAMSMLRPGEFDPSVPVAQRYPVDFERRFAEHLDAYLSRRRVRDPDSVDVGGFRRSGVRVVSPNAGQLRAFAEVAAHRGDDPEGALAELLETATAGTPRALSPKVAAAVDLVRRAVAGGRRVAVVCRHARTATLVRTMSRPIEVVVCDAGAAVSDADVVVVRFERDLPDLRDRDEVVVLDWPWSTGVLDAAVGGAAEEVGPGRVTVVHLADSIDDRVAMLAAHRRERGHVRDAAAPPGTENLTYLLAARF